MVHKRGAIKSIAGRFTSLQSRDSSSSSSDDSSDEDDDPRRRRPPPLRRSVTTARDPTGSDAVVLSENVPAELDPSVVRSTDGYRANDPVMESGRTRNMAERWRQAQEQDVSAPSRSSKPAWLIELENAKETEYGVFENEPEVCTTHRYIYIYLFAQSNTLRTIRQGLEQNSKAQTCTDSYPKITENPRQYKSKVKSK